MLTKKPYFQNSKIKLYEKKLEKLYNEKAKLIRKAEKVGQNKNEYSKPIDGHITNG